MADVSVVSTKLEQIEQYHTELQSMQGISSEEFLDDVTERRAVERMFENAIQACAGLAKHLATEDFGTMATPRGRPCSCSPRTT